VSILERANFPSLTFDSGIVGPPAHHLLGVEGVEGAQGPRFRKLTPQEIEDYLTNL
jgi:20S proteasome subunit alpha 2